MSFLLRGLISNISRLSMSQTPEISYKFAGYIPNRFRVTLSWLHRDFEKKQLKPPKKKKSALDGKPLAKGIILKNLIKKPRKPNSANRKCVLVKLSTGKEMVSYVPGEGHNLQEHQVVLCKVHRVKDTPGVKLTCVRGKYDLPHVSKK